MKLRYSEVSLKGKNKTFVKILGGRQHRTTPAGQILGVATPATPAALTPMGSILPHSSVFLHSFLTYLLPDLFCPSRINPLCFQAGCRKRRLNLALVFVFIVCCRAFHLIGERVLLLR